MVVSVGNMIRRSSPQTLSTTWMGATTKMLARKPVMMQMNWQNSCRMRLRLADRHSCWLVEMMNE